MVKNGLLLERKQNKELPMVYGRYCVNVFGCWHRYILLALGQVVHFFIGLISVSYTALPFSIRLIKTFEQTPALISEHNWKRGRSLCLVALHCIFFSPNKPWRRQSLLHCFTFYIQWLGYCLAAKCMRIYFVFLFVICQRWPD